MSCIWHFLIFMFWFMNSLFEIITKWYHNTITTEQHYSFCKAYFILSQNINYIITHDFRSPCYLEELDVLYMWNLLQLGFSPPQISDFLLHLFQEFFSSTHGSLFLIFDQLCHFRATSLNWVDQLSKDPLTLLHCSLSRALLGDTSQSIHYTSALTGLNWASVVLKVVQALHWLIGGQFELGLNV